jgi:hypothetical protein
MSDYNTANDLASQLVWGRTYQGDQPSFPLTKIVFHPGSGLDGDETVVVENDGKSDWNVVASRIHALLAAYPNFTTLPCEYCGATELEDVFHCDECGEPIPHGHEHGGTDKDGDSVTYCDDCQPAPGAGVDITDMEHTSDTRLDNAFEQEL